MAEMNNLAKPQETLVVNLNKTVKKKNYRDTKLCLSGFAMVFPLLASNPLFPCKCW